MGFISFVHALETEFTETEFYYAEKQPKLHFVGFSFFPRPY